MMELKKEFTKKGIKFTQIYKDSELVIYELSEPFADGDGHSIWYEVFERKVCSADRYHDDVYEKYPFDEAFGVWAWSCSNIECINKVLKREFSNHPMAKDGFKR